MPCGGVGILGRVGVKGDRARAEDFELEDGGEGASNREHEQMPDLGETLGECSAIGGGILETRCSPIGVLVWVLLTGEVPEIGVYTLFSGAGNFGNLEAVEKAGSFLELEGDELFDFREAFLVETGDVGFVGVYVGRANAELRLGVIPTGPFAAFPVS